MIQPSVGRSQDGNRRRSGSCGMMIKYGLRRIWIVLEQKLYRFKAQICRTSMQQASHFLKKRKNSKKKLSTLRQTISLCLPRIRPLKAFEKKHYSETGCVIIQFQFASLTKSYMKTNSLTHAWNPYCRGVATSDVKKWPRLPSNGSMPLEYYEWLKKWLYQITALTIEW